MSYQEIAEIILTFIILQASGGFVQRAGERLFERIEETFRNVRQKLKGDPYAERTLERTIEKPESEERRAMLKEVLIEKMEKDNEFVENLMQLIQDANQADINHILALGKRSVSVDGNVKNSTIITGDSNVVGSGSSQSIPATRSSKISGVNQIAGGAKDIDRKD